MATQTYVVNLAVGMHIIVWRNFDVVEERAQVRCPSPRLSITLFSAWCAGRSREAACKPIERRATIMKLNAPGCSAS